MSMTLVRLQMDTAINYYFPCRREICND